MTDIETLKQHGVQIDLFSYRGHEIPLYEDIMGHQIVAIFDNKLFELGYFNTTYQEDLKLIIDDYLDTITRFENDPFWYGSKLEYFQNKDSRDIRLLYRGRILKIYIDPHDIELIKQDARNILFKMIQEWRIKNETDS